MGFPEFYPRYLAEHSNRTCRRLHFAGTAWVGHFFFEKNRPATFTHPLLSFAGDWVMWKDMLTGRIRF
jgi:hypothetical protein